MSLASLWSERPAGWILFEDEDLVFVDKPAGMGAAPGQGRDDDALTRTARLLSGEERARPESLMAAVPLEPRASGVVVYARSAVAQRAMTAPLERGLVRCYLAGIEQDESAEGPVGSSRPRQGAHGPDRGRAPARLRRIVTRTLRGRAGDPCAELRRDGTPVAGDVERGGTATARLMLHRAAIELEHPRTGSRLRIECPPPPALERWLAVGADLLADPVSIDLTLRAAAGRRWQLGADPTTTAFRLFHGEGDGIAGLTVDRYDDYLVVWLVGRAVEARERLLDAVEQLGPTGVYLKLPPRDPRASASLRPRLAPAHAVRGASAPAPLWVSEQGLEYDVRLGEGMSTGLFVDQRSNRQLVRARARGKRVLNLFAYTGSFTAAAIAGGAIETTTVDVSRPVLDWAARNIERLLGRPADPAHRLVRADAIAWLAGATRRGERFDAVVLDPPSFATTRSSRFSAASDYGPLALASLRCVAPRGWLLACTNHGATSLASFVARLEGAVQASGRRPRSIEALPHPVDCPAPPGRDGHLKAVLVRLED